ncbi:hypothetical protein F5B20DRAFT_249014 [Whalleya microplaca]|nr:hypothetical protein F5B20DRAFT_249014 [Whalleya microplaca]
MDIQTSQDQLSRFTQSATQATQRGRKDQISQQDDTEDPAIEPDKASKKLRELKNKLVFSQLVSTKKRRSLRQQLIRDGRALPRGPTHPIHSSSRKAHAKNRSPKRLPAIPTRPLLVPSGDEPDSPPPRPLRKVTPPGFQPDREIATEETPFHRLYYPFSLRASCKMNEHKWNDKVAHSDKTVFVFVRQINDDIVEMLVFESLMEANTYALHVMANKHPSAFAVPREDSPDAEVKVEEPERAQSVLRQLNTWPSARKDRDVIRLVDGGGEVVEPHFRIKSEDPEVRGPIRRLPDARPETNVRGEILLGMAPEAKYLYWGEWKFTSCCLKMEARHRDGTCVKISVSLKNLRKPIA